MSRNLSLAMLVASFAQETGDAIIPLLTITHDDWDDNIYAAMNGTDIVSRGITFTAYPFDLIVPDDSADRPPQATITIDNIDRRLTEAMSSTIVAPSITIEIIRGSDPDTIEVTWTGLTLKEVKFNKYAISGTLTYEDISKETYPSGTFTPAWFPGMF